MRSTLLDAGWWVGKARQGRAAGTVGVVTAGIRSRLSEVAQHPLARNIGALTSAGAIVTLLAMIQGLVAARWLGPAVYGSAILAVSLPEFVFTLLEPRSLQATMRFGASLAAAGEHERLLAVIKVGYLVDLAVAAVSVGIVVLLSKVGTGLVSFGDASSGLVLAYAGIALGSRPLVFTSRAVLALADRFQAIALIDIATTAFRVVLVIAAMAAGFGIEGVVLGLAAGHLANGVLFAVVSGRERRRRWGGGSPLRVPLSRLEGMRRPLFHFLALNNVSRGMWALRRVDVLIVGKLAGATAAGFYNLAQTGASVANVLVAPLEEVAYSEMVRSEAARTGESRRRARRLTTSVGLPCGFLALLGAVPLPWVLPVVFGPSYEPAGLAASMFLAAGSTRLFGFAVRPLFLASGHIATWTKISTASMVLFLPGFVLATSHYGFQGGAAYWVALDILTMAAAAILAVRSGPVVPRSPERRADHPILAEVPNAG